MIKILIADDHVLFREGMESLLKNHTDFEIAGSASDGREAVAMARSLQPDLVLMDVNMPNMDGLQALERINAANPDILVVMLTSLATRHVVERCLELGAVNFVRKDTPKEAMAKVLRETIEDHFGEE